MVLFTTPQFSLHKKNPPSSPLKKRAPVQKKKQPTSLSGIFCCQFQLPTKWGFIRLVFLTALTGWVEPLRSPPLAAALILLAMLGSELASLKGELFTLMSSCVVKRREGKGPEKRGGKRRWCFLFWGVS